MSNKKQRKGGYGVFALSTSYSIIMENMADSLRNLGSKNDFNQRVQIFLDSIRELSILENEISYGEMLQKMAVAAGKNLSAIEEKNSFDEAAMEEYINIYSDIMEEFSKYQIIFVGDHIKARILSQLVDTKHVHILDPANENIPDYCDYVLILDIDNVTLNISSEHSKVIRLDRLLLRFEISPEVAYYNKKLNDALSDTLGVKKGYVTGLSYEQRGILWEEIGFDLGCLAAPSQDLFLDTLCYMEVYQRVKEKYGVELQYCVLGMSFYALWYDLSLSSNANRMVSYYDRVKSLHHLNIDVPMETSEDLLLCKQIFTNNFLDSYFDIYYDAAAKSLEAIKYEEYNPNATYENDIAEIKKMFHKPYEKTFSENVGILKRFLKFLSFHKIRTIVYIPPFPELFNQYTPEDMKSRTLSFLQDMQKEFHFEILDVSTSKEFDDTCFSDWHHLNLKGAKKATQILNQFMGEVWGNKQLRV